MREKKEKKEVKDNRPSTTTELSPWKNKPAQLLIIVFIYCIKCILFLKITSMKTMNDQHGPIARQSKQSLQILIFSNLFMYFLKTVLLLIIFAIIVIIRYCQRALNLNWYQECKHHNCQEEMLLCIHLLNFGILLQNP